MIKCKCSSVTTRISFTCRKWLYFPSKRFKIRRVRLQSSAREEKSVVRRPRSFGRSGSKFVPKKTNRRFLFRSRNKESDESTKTVKQSLENVAINNNPISPVKPARRRFTPSTSARSKYRLNINTRPLKSVTEDVDVESNEPEPLNIRPTPSIANEKRKYETREELREPEPLEGNAEALHLDNYPIIISSIDNDISGTISYCLASSVFIHIKRVLSRPDNRHPRTVHADQGPVWGDSHFIIRGVYVLNLMLDLSLFMNS